MPVNLTLEVNVAKSQLLLLIFDQITTFYVLSFLYLRYPLLVLFLFWSEFVTEIE